MSKLVSTLLHIIDTKILRSWVKCSIWYVAILLSYLTYLMNDSNPGQQVHKSFAYLTPERFPHNWAIADMVKGYLAGTRKEHHRQAREDEAGCNGATNNLRSKNHSRDSKFHILTTSLPALVQNQGQQRDQGNLMSKIWLMKTSCQVQNRRPKQLVHAHIRVRIQGNHWNTAQAGILTLKQPHQSDKDWPMEHRHKLNPPPHSEQMTNLKDL